MRKLLACLLIIFSFGVYAEENDYPATMMNSYARKDTKAKIYLTSDVLYFHPEVDGAAYVQKGRVGLDNSTGSSVFGVMDVNGEIAKVDPNWDLGFRVGLGYKFCHDGFTFDVSWMRFYTYFIDYQEGSLLDLWPDARIPNFSGTHTGNSSNRAAFAEETWKFHINTLDGLLSRNFYIAKHLTLKPSVGITAAYIDQSLEIALDHYVTYSTQKQAIVFGKDSMRSILRAMGIKSALESKFMFNYFGFYGNASLSYLYGHFNCDYEIEMDGKKDSFSRDRFNDGICSANIGLGIYFDFPLYCDKAYLLLKFGWEEDIWFSVNKIIHGYNSLSEGKVIQQNDDVTLHGIVFNASLNF